MFLLYLYVFINTEMAQMDEIHRHPPDVLLTLTL